MKDIQEYPNYRSFLMETFLTEKKSSPGSYLITYAKSNRIECSDSSDDLFWKKEFDSCQYSRNRTGSEIVEIGTEIALRRWFIAINLRTPKLEPIMREGYESWSAGKILESSEFLTRNFCRTR